MESTIKHSDGMKARVNDPNAKVTLYGPDGEDIQVSAGRVDYWLSQGFSLTQADPKTRLAAFDVAHKTAKEAVHAYHTGVVEDGTIDPGDQAAYATAVAAMDDMICSFNDLVTDIGRQYKVKQEEGVTLKRGEDTMQVDPSQVDEFAKNGWKAEK